MFQAKFFYNQIRERSICLDQDVSLELVCFFDRPATEGLNIRLVGAGARLRLIALFLTTGASKSKLKLNIVHQAPATESQIFLKAVAADQSEVALDALARVAKGAKGAKTRLVIKGLIASPEARIKPLPALEIEENEVTAGHAAAVGRLDEEQLFYLMSRGLNRETARQLLINGFVEEVFDKIKSPVLRGRLRERLKIEV